MFVRSLVVAVVLLCQTAELPAQEVVLRSRIDSGMPIRVWLRSGITDSGRMAFRVAPGDLRLGVCGIPARGCSVTGLAERVRIYDVAALTRIETRSGSRLAAGALGGGLLGFVVVGAIGLVKAGFCDAPGCSHQVRYSVGGAIGGALIGALVGGSMHHWSTP